MTPLHWQILLHHYVTSEPYAARDPRHANSNAVREYRDQLAGWELIEWREGLPVVTSRGHALINHIKNLPLPECRWFMPNVSPHDGQGSGAV